MEVIKVYEISELAQEFNHSPKLERRGNDMAILYDYETDSGEYKWKGLLFKEVVDFKRTKDSSINAEMLKAYNAVANINNSSWAKEYKNEHHISNNKIISHFLIYFDGYGAYEFLASGFTCI